MTGVLVALIGLLGTLGAAQIVRLGQVKKLVNGDMTRLIELIERRDAEIARLRGET